MTTIVKEMFILDGGSITLGKAMLTYGRDFERHVKAPVPFFAFDTEDGWILFDTGWPIEAIPILEQMGIKAEITEENIAVEQLKKIGVSPSQITKVIVSHMHVDHVGSLRSFPDAEFFVQKDEYAYAHHPNSFNAEAYQPFLYDMPNAKWNLMDGDDVILPGITAILNSGHTPGMQSLIVELPESGFCLLGGDAAYLQENINDNLPPGIVWNPVLAQYSIKRLKALASLLHGKLFPGHDIDFYDNEVSYCQGYK